MRLLALSFFFLPASIFVLTLSLTTLINFEQIKNKKQVLGFPFSEMTNYRPAPVNPNSIPGVDARVAILKKFFSDYRSPLFDQAEEIVKQADLNGLDYALIPAIAMQESGGCKTIPYNSYNCWGFGIYGDKTTRFANYEEAIAKVTKTIKEAYIKRGLTNPTLLEDRWTPSSVGHWSYSVNFFIGKIRKYEKN